MPDGTVHDVAGMQAVPLSDACGAMITGIDLNRPLEDQEVAFLQDAWNKHLVLVFRGQELSEEDQQRFAAYFGPLGDRKVAPAKLKERTEGLLQNNPEFMLVTNMKVDGKPIGAFGDGDMWFHIDSGYSPRPYRYTFLYGLKLPSTGGNTLFANTYKAYDAVPQALKEKLTGCKALHIHEYKRNEKVDISADISNSPHHYHPVFISHPRTGRKALFVDRLMTRAIAGMEPEESDAVMEQLYEIGERKEHIYEHEWQLGDFVMWDNLATIHARTYFPKGEDRLLRRCTVEGIEVSE